MPIYTKKGDQGETGLYSGRKRLKKDSIRIRAVGAVDEMNSFLGVVISTSDDSDLVTILKEIQNDLLIMGSILGGSGLRFSKVKVRKIEKEIDKLEAELPKLTNFIVPGGTETAARLHFARTLVRRTEREVVSLSKIEAVKPQILTYLNRLSDGLFMFARRVNFRKSVKEEVWKTGR
jgi:cob(I)alamin adenosyltransferase